MQVAFQRARALEDNARRLEKLAERIHWNEIARQLREALAGKEKEIDLFHAGLIVARLDNPQLDVDAYRVELDRMADEIKASINCSADDEIVPKAIVGTYCHPESVKIESLLVLSLVLFAKIQPAVNEYAQPAIGK